MFPPSVSYPIACKRVLSSLDLFVMALQFCVRRLNDPVVAETVVDPCQKGTQRIVLHIAVSLHSHMVVVVPLANASEGLLLEHSLGVPTAVTLI